MVGKHYALGFSLSRSQQAEWMVNKRDPFPTVGRRKKLAYQIQKWRSICLRPVRPTRIRPGRPGPPNLVVLAVDTLRYDHLGLAGYPRPVSPFIDRLADDGVCFDDVFAPAPWTLPSFGSSLTGVMPTFHGARLTGPVRNMDTQAPATLASGFPTLAEHLRHHGYRTAAFYSNPFFAFGLAETFGRHVYRNLPASDLTWLALEWIRRHGDQPFFCFVLLNDPHEPTTPPGRFLRPLLAELARRGLNPEPDKLHALTRWGQDADPASDLGRATLPLNRVTAEALALKIALYDAAIAYVDQVVAEVVGKLQAWGLAERTLMTLYSDHGEEFLDHADAAHRWNHDPREIRAIGHGHTQFQELLHVPWLAWGPGLPAGRRVSEPVSLCDVAPTLAAWLGLPPLPLPPAPLAGLTGRVLPTDPDPGDDPRPRLLLAEEMAYGPDLGALRQGEWKLIATRAGEVLGLFDLARDPEEREELAPTRPELVVTLQEALASWRTGGGDPGDPSRSGDWQEVSDTVRRRLRELGYSD